MSSLPDVIDRYRRERAFQIAEVSERQRERLLEVLGNQSAQAAELAQSAGRLVGTTQDIAAEVSRMAAVADWAFPAIVEHLALTAERLGGVEQMLANPAETAAAEFYRNGTYALANGWWKDAVTDLSEAVQRYKYNPRTWFNLGVAQQRNNFTTAAAETYGQCAQYGVSIEPALAARAALLAAFNYRAAMQVDASAKILRAYAEKIDRCAELHLALGVHHQDHAHLVKALSLAPTLAVDARVGKTSGLEEAAAVVCHMADGPVHRLRAIEQAAVRLIDIAYRAGLEIVYTVPAPVNLPIGGVDALLLAHDAIPEAAEQVNHLGLEIRNKHRQGVSAAAVAARQASLAQSEAVTAAQMAQAMESSARDLAEEVAQADAMVHASSLSQAQNTAAPARATPTPAQEAARQAHKATRQAREAAAQAREAAAVAKGRVLSPSAESVRAASHMADLREELTRAGEILTCVTEACHSTEPDTGDDLQRYSAESEARHRGGSGMEVQTASWVPPHVRLEAMEAIGNKVQTGSWAPVHVQLEAIVQQVKLRAWQQSIEAEDPGLAAAMRRLESANETYHRANSESLACDDRPIDTSLWGGKRNWQKEQKERKALGDAAARAGEARQQAESDCSRARDDALLVTARAWAAGLTQAWRRAVVKATRRKAQLTADVTLAERDYEQAAQLLADCQQAMWHAEDVARRAEVAARRAEEAAQQTRHQAVQAGQAVQAEQQAKQQAVERERRSQDAWQMVTGCARSLHAPDEVEQLTANIRSRLVSSGDGTYGRVEAEREFWGLLRDPARQRAQTAQEESDAAMRVEEEAAGKVRDALSAVSASESIVEASRHAAARPARIIPFDLPGEWSDLES
jgi:hypothetical protein